MRLGVAALRDVGVGADGGRAARGLAAEAVQPGKRGGGAAAASSSCAREARSLRWASAR